MIALSLLLLMLGSVGAAVRLPQEVIQDTSAQMIDALRKNSAALRQDSSRIYELVEQIVLPNFDFQLMSRWVLGRAWQQATAEQRRLFADEFRTLLVRTYAKALLEYADQDIRVPPQPPASSDQTTVRTEVQPKTGRPIQINYSMNLGPQGWKVYDVTVDSVSLVTNYRSTFASQIRNNGLDAVIADLRQRNAQRGR
ncbi:MAG: ABC transporter substrate-binding protein [Candidatus Competibacteraceae bacterium]